MATKKDVKAKKPGRPPKKPGRPPKKPGRPPKKPGRPPKPTADKAKTSTKTKANAKTESDAKAKPKPIRILTRSAKHATAVNVKDDNAAAEAEQAMAFAMSIAEQMKLKAAKDDAKIAEAEIRLSRRPTTRKQGSTTVKFPAADLKEFRKRLMEARARATSGVNAMRATGFNEADDHEADGGDGTAQTLRLQALGQMGNINRVIQQIDEALHRIDDGTYGVCTSCGQLIRKPRLINQPFVLTCMECQQEMERGAK